MEEGDVAEGDEGMGDKVSGDEVEAVRSMAETEGEGEG